MRNRNWRPLATLAAFAAVLILLPVAIARADGQAPPAPTGLDWQVYVGIALAALAGVDALIRALSAIVRSFASHTATTIDDRIADGLDNAHTKLDELLGVVGRIVPAAQAKSGGAS